MCCLGSVRQSLADICSRRLGAMFLHHTRTQMPRLMALGVSTGSEEQVQVTLVEQYLTPTGLRRRRRSSPELTFGAHTIPAVGERLSTRFLSIAVFRAIGEHRTAMHGDPPSVVDVEMRHLRYGLVVCGASAYFSLIGLA